MLSLLFDKNIYGILALFSLSPGSRFRRNEIKVKVKLNNIPLDASLRKLTASRILTRQNNIFSLNFENKESENLILLIKKEHSNLKNIPLNAYLPLIDIADALSLSDSIEVYLFGSYSKLIFSNKSDIDIAVVYNKSVDKSKIKKKMQKIEKKCGKRIEMHFFDKNSFYKNKKDTFVKDILRNGVKLI